MPNFSLPVFHVDSAIFKGLVVVLESMFLGKQCVILQIMAGRAGSAPA
jgi:hypothetical protein